MIAAPRKRRRARRRQGRAHASRTMAAMARPFLAMQPLRRSTCVLADVSARRTAAAALPPMPIGWSRTRRSGLTHRAQRSRWVECSSAGPVARFRSSSPNGTDAGRAPIHARPGRPPRRPPQRVYGPSHTPCNPPCQYGQIIAGAGRPGSWGARHITVIHRDDAGAKPRHRSSHPQAVSGDLTTTQMLSRRQVFWARLPSA